MSKLRALFGGGGNQEEGHEETGTPVTEEQAAPAPPAPEPVPEPAIALYVPTNPYSSIDDYAASLPAPDYVDPAGKASASSEAA